MAQETKLAKLNTNEIETLDKIKEKLGGKELSDAFRNEIVKTGRLWLSAKEAVQILYRFAINQEKLAKEEAKTVVAIIMGLSIRSTEYYIPEDLKDKKYISDKSKETQQSKKLKQHEDKSSPGILNENGQYGTAGQQQQEQSTATIEDGIITETKEVTPVETPEQTLKRLSKPFKQDCDIVVLGRSFTVQAKVNVLERTVELIYDENDIAKVLRGNRK